MKERDTAILAVRIKKTLLAEIARKVAIIKQPSRNAWMTWAIKQGLRRHKKEKGNV